MVDGGGGELELDENAITEMLINENIDADRVTAAAAGKAKQATAGYTPGALIALFANHPLRKLPEWFDKVARQPAPKSLKTKADVDAKWFSAQTVMLSLASGGLPAKTDKVVNWRDQRSKHECRQLALIIHLLLLNRVDLALEAACRRYEGVLIADRSGNFRAASGLDLISDSASTISGADIEKLEMIAPSSAAVSTSRDAKGKAKTVRSGALEDAAATLAADKPKAAPSGQSGGPGGRGAR